MIISLVPPSLVLESRFLVALRMSFAVIPNLFHRCFIDLHFDFDGSGEMTFNDVLKKVQRIILCDRKDERKASLEIGSPTDVRRIGVSEGMPGLSDTDKKYIRKKAPNDAIRLLSLQSRPPIRPFSLPPSRSRSPSSSHTPTSPTSREPSHPLLNAASSNLPPTLPTPAPKTHRHLPTNLPQEEHVGAHAAALGGAGEPFRGLSGSAYRKERGGGGGGRARVW
ncbi:hypothetical protein K458DRAFT_176554 [Lentithecium fluviatile CBS 122367]|uniref:EF-hand domain-containing protein n=1 Tax=Lentithecium fluviatile CBS 122367 TaxID=1168545 RepID=A0A6G1JDA7_9PLEO|nr:hypothetical protein K458DRAFT_176554 [Lentithecium fluviatile CBS 122367]